MASWTPTKERTVHPYVIGWTLGAVAIGCILIGVSSMVWGWPVDLE